VDVALVAEADVVMEAFGVEAFEHVVDSLVGEGCEEDALSLLAEAFDDFGDDAGFACARWALHEQVVLHLEGAFDGEVLFVVEVGTAGNAYLVEAWT
jgi:hypothetical protein